MADAPKDGVDDTTVAVNADAETAAAEASKEDASASAKQLQSLLDFQVEQDLPSFSRVMLAAKLTGRDAEALASLPAAFARLVKDFRLDVTGLAVVQDTVFVGVFECFPDDLCTFVRRVAALVELSGVKILANSEDCPSRQFMPLSFHRLRLAKEGDIDLDGEFSDVATASFCAYEKMLGVGKAMRASNSSSSIPQNLQSSVPSNSRVLAYLGHEGFYSADQFLEVFDDPVHEVPVLDSIWPHQGGIPLS